MARYLLNAPDEDMERWKADARECGVPFSRWLREAAQAAVISGVVTEKPTVKTKLTGQSVTPDWKR